LRNDSTASAENQSAPLTKGSALARLAGIGVVILAVSGAFLHLGGWFSPKALTPARFTDGFERVDGIYSGFRRNHAKGVGVSDFFESNGQGTRLLKAVVFKTGRAPVIGRFSLAGGNPMLPTPPTWSVVWGFYFGCLMAKNGGWR
jgi:catalase